MKKESIEELRARLMKDDQVVTMIRMRAFEIYQGRGGRVGNSQHDWLQAENEILSYLIREEASLTAGAPAKEPAKKAASKKVKRSDSRAVTPKKAKGKKEPSAKKGSAKKKKSE